MGKIWLLTTANFLSGSGLTLSILHLCGFAINPLIGFAIALTGLSCAIADYKL